MASFYLILLVLFALVSLAYYLALPRVIPHIPHNRTSAHSILGDLPHLLANFKATSENVNWMTQQCVSLNSPLIQLFLWPGAFPLIVLSDHRETEDILVRRTREFDRSDIIARLLGGLVPYATIVMPSHDLFKSQRRIWANTMSTAFLNEVAAPQIHEATMDLVRLWRRKQALAGGRCFAAAENIRHAAMDAIWAVAVGTKLGGVQTQLDFLGSKESISVPNDDPEAPVEFPEAAMPAVYTAISTLLDSVAGILSSPFPKVYAFFMRQRSWYRTANAMKTRTMRELLRKCRDEFVRNPKSALQRPASAMEHVLRREASELAKEEARDSKRGSRGDEREMIDELFMFLVAGHETTATTTTWGLKYLASSPAIQDRLHRAIKTALPSASPRQIPSADQLMAADIPYLDAAIAEMLRCGRTTTGAVRVAKVDCEVLGYHIPKGSSILCSTCGPSYLHDSLHVDEESRSQSSKAAGGKCKEWESRSKRDFKPERWLERNGDEDGDGESGVVFNPNAGPSLPFGAGPRGCFGKKLALMEMRIMIILLLLNFELKEVPDSLGGYDAIEGVTVTRQPRKCFVKLGLRDQQ